MTVYVVIFHDVWDLGRDPGEENEYGAPEETVIERIYENRASAQAFIDQNLAAFPDTNRTYTFYTIEEHQLTP